MYVSRRIDREGRGRSRFKGRGQRKAGMALGSPGGDLLPKKAAGRVKVKGDQQAGDENVGWVRVQRVLTAPNVDAEKRSVGIKETRKATASEREGKVGGHASQRR